VDQLAESQHAIADYAVRQHPKELDPSYQLAAKPEQGPTGSWATAQPIEALRHDRNTSASRSSQIRI